MYFSSPMVKTIIGIVCILCSLGLLADQNPEAASLGYSLPSLVQRLVRWAGRLVAGLAGRLYPSPACFCALRPVYVSNDIYSFYIYSRIYRASL